MKKVLTDSDAARRKADGKIQSLMTEYNEYEEEATKAQEGLEVSKRKIAGYRNEISKLEKMNQELPDPKSTGPELAAISKELETVQAQMRKLQDNEKQAIRLSNEREAILQQKRAALGKVDSDRQQREDRFRSTNYEVYQLMTWIRKNEALFKGTVKGPLALELQPKSEQAATLLERMIPKNVLGGFLVTSSEDMEVLRKKAKELHVKESSTKCGVCCV